MSGADGFFFSFCALAIFLLLGKALRVRISLLQRLFLPSSIIAGFIALACGPYVFKLIPEWVLGYWSKIPGVLISVVFASLFLGVAIPSPKRLWHYRRAAALLRRGDGRWTVFRRPVGHDVHPLTALWHASYIRRDRRDRVSGGHGTAAGMKETFEDSVPSRFRSGADVGHGWDRRGRGCRDRDDQPRHSARLLRLPQRAGRHPGLQEAGA
jgi:ESS family glutamate:Na+ symporter